VLYVIRQIFTSTTHASADFCALQSSVISDATDYIAISLALSISHSAPAAFQPFWSVTG